MHPNTQPLFITPLYRAPRGKYGKNIDPRELLAACLSIAEDDEAGQKWCDENDFPGYTSYASLTDLAWRFPTFADLSDSLQAHAEDFAQSLYFDLDGKDLHLDALWINILPPGGIHTSHIHPHSVISGTTYVAMPDGTSALKLEDPRLPMMMAAPTRTQDASEGLKQFVYLHPKTGEVLMWESWLRHEVLMNMTEENRISISFNFGWR